MALSPKKSSAQWLLPLQLPDQKTLIFVVSPALLIQNMSYSLGTFCNGKMWDTSQHIQSQPFTTTVMFTIVLF